MKHYLNMLATMSEGAASAGAAATSAAAVSAAEAGVATAEGFQFFHEYQPSFPFEADVPALRRASQEEVAAAAARSGEAYTDGVWFRSVIVDSPSYLRWLMRQLSDVGVRFETRTIGSLAELADYDIVLNCTGLGARELVGDAAVHAVRGQTIRVHAPHINQFQMGSSGPGHLTHQHSTYILPRNATGIVVCGGTHQRGREDGHHEGDAAGVWERCTKLCPELLDGRVVKVEHWAGLRPAREGDLRLEVEEVLVATATGDSKALLVAHNYGHGGCGHSLHWGCALDITTRVVEAAAKRWPGMSPAVSVPPPLLATATTTATTD